ncbi:hypothetical protein L226DRAFT_198817 [Lentinus tigrinus ALCF2SS1-7]|uniref:Hemerythrin-like domain-containing protein n=1 Tax=Lentinus tigrinus ALCF2SS1-6 TaxID=1328759 RepID=A0A5C2SRC1_9APHY|nr:hypothetical protein L227DRAFT_649156 [Lentinus tigrinus ALCF2SS1-6]RPD80366.1 hypothetical protein L226DRAFT_198817 [Lentinus tigrinus ALCF2SS1-7]
MSLDIIEILKTDEDNIHDLYIRWKAAQTTDKIAIGNTLMREMFVHGDAKSISVYNSFEYNLGLKKDADMNRKVHDQIKQYILEADRAQPGSQEYDSAIKRAVDIFLQHSQAEDQQLRQAEKKLSVEESDKLARAFLKARRNASTNQLSPKKEFVSVKTPLPQV